MKRKPWAILVLSLLHILAPIGSFFLNALHGDRTLQGQWDYWFNVMPKHFLFVLVVLPILAGVFIYLCRRWSYWAYLECLALMLVYNVYAFSTNMNVPTFVVLLLVLVLDVLAVAYFMVPSVQQVYFDPRLRWWEAAARYNFNQEGTLNGHKGFIKNLSKGGLFAQIGKSLRGGEIVEITWSYGDTNYKAQGEVVYSGVNPEGYGIRFTDSGVQPPIKPLLKELDAKDLVVKERLPGPEDSFSVWLSKLIRTREGLFPRTGPK